MKYNLLAVFLFLFTFTTVMAQNKKSPVEGYQMDVHILNKSNEKVYLISYWNDMSYAVDSLTLKDGKGTFASDRKLAQGQYLLHVGPDLDIDLLLGSTPVDVSLVVDENDLDKSTVVGSRDTELLWQYMVRQEKYFTELDVLEDKLDDEAISESEATILMNELDKVNASFNKYTQSLIKKHKNDWFGIYLRGRTMVELPHQNASTDAEMEANRDYRVAHFFDNLELRDARIWTTDYTFTYINSYLDSWMSQHPDSLTAATFRLVELTQNDKFAHPRMLSFLINKYLQSPIMGYENIWARLYEAYVIDKDVNWADAKTLEALNLQYELLKNNRIGMEAMNMNLRDINGKPVSSNNIKSEYLAVVFYSNDCSHCKEDMPVLQAEYEKYKDKGLKILAVNASPKAVKKEWQAFIKELKMNDWINCSDPDFKSEFWINYDVSSTPSIYLLNKDKKIIGRKLNGKTVGQLMDIYLHEKEN